MDYLLLLLAGAALCNGIPHLVSGLRGDRFPTPFARPPGIGDSAPLINFLWGAGNLVVGIFIANRRLPIVQHGLAVLVVGFVAIGIALALHFGRVRRR